MWVKGQSGNPSGRSKNLVEIEKLARQHAPAAIAALALALTDPKTSVAAAKVLLDRGFGMPAQQLNATVSVFDGLDDGAAERIEAALTAVIARAEGGAGRAAEAETLQ